MARRYTQRPRGRGLTKAPDGGVRAEYIAWCGMVSRCTKPLNKCYARYGGRGIRVCDEWLHDFAAFLAYLGPRPTPGHSVDRIDVDGHYEPGNVRWATVTEQQRNRRSNRHVTAFGRTQTVAAWAEEFGIDQVTVGWRLRRGWAAEAAVSELPGTRPKGRTRGAKVLSDADVVAVREIATTGASEESIAKRFGVNKTTIHNIVRGHTRRSAGGPLRGASWRVSESLARDVLAARARDGLSIPELSDKFGTSKTTVHRILTGETWKYVAAELELLRMAAAAKAVRA